MFATVCDHGLLFSESILGDKTVDLRKIDDRISVTPQIQIADLPAIAALGFKTLVANRPDNEEPGQPLMAGLEEAARKHGLHWVYMPVASGNISDDDVERFGAMIRTADAPVLAFCRSGTRSTVLWALSSASETPAKEIFEKAQSAGYNISGIAPRLAQQAQKKS
jgi:sulfide:quinone oxidoreductase